MNLSEMRKYRIEEKFAEMLSEITYRVAQDQDYLNKLCRGRVYYLNQKWNKTPMPHADRSVTPKIAHYKINFKPWRYDDIPYADIFWKYAEKTPFYNYFADEKANYSEAEKKRDSVQFSSLARLALEEIQNSNTETSDSFILVEA
jgi:lipopolysaccharide biosynthesis glycosyltransferase